MRCIMYLLLFHVINIIKIGDSTIDLSIKYTRYSNKYIAVSKVY